MIHNLDTLTVRSYGLVESTGKLRYFKKRLNFLPNILFTKKIEALVSEIGENLGANQDRELIKEKARIMAFNKILLLETLAKAIYNIIVLKADTEKWGTIKKNKKVSNDLGEYIIKVRELTMIQITDLTSFGKLGKHIEVLKSKFESRYIIKETTEEKIDFISYAWAVFEILEQPYNSGISMNEFFKAEKLAKKRTKELQKIRDKNG